MYSNSNNSSQRGNSTEGANRTAGGSVKSGGKTTVNRGKTVSGGRKSSGNSKSSKSTKSARGKGRKSKKKNTGRLNRILLVCFSIILICLVIYFIYDYLRLKTAEENSEYEAGTEVVRVNDFTGSGKRNGSGTGGKNLSGQKQSVNGKKESSSGNKAGNSGKSENRKNGSSGKTESGKNSGGNGGKNTSSGKNSSGVTAADGKKDSVTAGRVLAEDKKTSAVESGSLASESSGCKKTENAVKEESKAVSSVNTVSSGNSSGKKQASDIPVIPWAQKNAKLTVIFDDGGQNLNQLEKCITLPFPVTVAVLPRLAHSKEAAERVRKSGNEVMLHQPMQAVNLNVNPGEGAVKPGMDEETVKAILYENLKEVGPVAGLNNHEGSMITADAEEISYVMKAAAEYGIFFLDSRTNVETKVPYVASQLGYSYYERNVFLDNTKKRSDIINEIMKGVKIANQKGCAIMIGHVWSADCLPAVLAEMYPLLKAKGYVFTTVSGSGAEIFP